MEIVSNSIIKLKDDREYLVVRTKRIEGDEFCLLSTLNKPIEMKVARVYEQNSKTIIEQYKGGDYKYILAKLLDV